MALYHTASTILQSDPKTWTSLKTLVFSPTPSAPTAISGSGDKRQLYALLSETVRWSEVLSEVVVGAGLLGEERRLSPALSILLVHDLLLAKRGIAAPATHPLRVAIERHKARLQAELVRARVRRRCGSLDELKARVLAQGQQDGPIRPRWVRVNTLKTNLEEQLRTTFKDYRQVDRLADVVSQGDERRICMDGNVPDLFAVTPGQDLTKVPAYTRGQIILQDKASCFPAVMLDPRGSPVLDACAAPGNKTTHLAALLHEQHPRASRHTTTVYACERDRARQKVLTEMVCKAGAQEFVDVLQPAQDFLQLRPEDHPWATVRAILLDPSCSGSGIIGRDDDSGLLNLVLPELQQPITKPGKQRKRKRGASADSDGQASMASPAKDDLPPEEQPPEEKPPEEKLTDLTTRLKSLSAFQVKLLLHAFTFRQATRVVYSTCSSYTEEDEHVVVQALQSDGAKHHKWRILRRDEQVDGMRHWPWRGRREACAEVLGDVEDEIVEEVSQACIRCNKGTADGTQGFFLAGFVRDAALMNGHEELDSEDEWHGFDT